MPVRVNGQEISVEQIRREAQYHPAASFESACHEATRALVIKQLLLDEAKRLNIPEPDGDEDAEQSLIGELMDRTVQVPEVNKNACREFYENAKGKFRGPDLFAPSHILFAAPEGDTEARSAAKLRAQEVLTELLDRPERFARIARTSSGCPSGASGGSLGQITRGETMPEFERALESLEPEEICPEAVETKHGFHVIKLDERAPGEPLPFEAVRDRITIYLRDEAWRSALHEFILKLAGQTAIENFSLDEAQPPLPKPNQRGLRLLQ